MLATGVPAGPGITAGPQPPRAPARPASDLAALGGPTRAFSGVLPPHDALASLPTKVEVEGETEDEGRDDLASTTAERDGDPGPPAPEPEAGLSIAVRPGLPLSFQRKLGEGGMGVVHLVQDERLGRAAALKQIRGDLTPARVSRFQREIRITARLNHPSIPPVYEANPEAGEGLIFMLMRFVEGESLRERLGRLWGQGGPDERQRREVLEGLVRACEAVGYAHSRGVVHRDLKPDNIMIGAFGEVLVMDWGLARDLGESAGEDKALRESVELDPRAVEQLTGAGACLGTIGFMPPEQMRQEEVDPRADIFSLGVILALAISGRSPLGDDALSRTENTHLGQVRSPRAVHPGVPRELDAIAMRAMAPNRADRYPTAALLAEDLKAWLEGRPVAAHTYSPLERLQLTVRRYPTATASLSMALLGLLGLLVVLRSHKLAQDRHTDELVAQSQALMETERFEEARDLFLRAGGQEAADPRVQLGLVRAEQGIARKLLGRTRERLEEAERQRERGQLEQARDSYLLATQVEGAPALREAALTGLRAVEERIARERELERQRQAEHARRSRARTCEEEGQRRLREGNHRAAYDAFVQAIAFGSQEAAEGLESARAGLAAEREAELRARAAELVVEGDARLREGALEEARRAYTQALAFAGANEAAQAGLVEVHERLARRQDEENARAVAGDLRAAAAAHEEAQAAYRAGEAPEDVQERYLRALELLDHALFLDPGHEEARRQKSRLARELALILHDEGRHDLAAFLERVGGVGSAAPDEALGVSLPIDPHLVVEEVDKEYVRQAFGGPVRFQPTRVFDRLREWVRQQEDGRYRARIRLRSAPTRDNPPGVQLLRLEVRLEDPQARTLSPVVNVPVPQAPLRRPVRSNAQGRAVAPLDATPGLDVDRIVREVEQALRELVARARAR